VDDSRKVISANRSIQERSTCGWWDVAIPVFPSRLLGEIVVSAQASCLEKPARWEVVIQYGMAAAIAIVSFLQYFKALAPSVLNDDPGELQVLIWKLGIPHGTSYPLFVWIGHLFMRLPVGNDIAFRLSLFSAVAGAFGLVVLFLLALELNISRTRVGAWVGAGVTTALVAYSYTYWSIAIIAAEYTLHVLMALVALLLLFRWRRFGTRGYLIAAFATLGAMFGNHAMTFGLIPGAALFVLLRQHPDRKVAKDVGLSLLAGTLAVAGCNLLLFYLLWRRSVPFDHWQWIVSCPHFFDLPPDARGRFWYAWWYEVTCRQFQHELTGASTALRLQQVAAIPHRLAAEYFPVAAALSVVGWVLMWRRRWRENVLITAVFVTHVHLVASLSITHKSHVYLLVASILAAVCAGVAVSWIGENLGLALVRRMPKVFSAIGNEKRRMEVIALVGAAATVVGLGIANQKSRVWYRDAMVREGDPFVRNAVVRLLDKRPDASRDRNAQLLARRVVDAIPPDAIVFTDWYVHYAIEYVARIERNIEGITVLESYPYGIGRREFVWDYRDIILDPARTRPLFFVSVQPPSFEGYRLVRRTSDVFELVRQQPKPASDSQ
jgi:hypothetical protein